MTKAEDKPEELKIKALPPLSWRQGPISLNVHPVKQEEVEINQGYPWVNMVDGDTEEGEADKDR